ncbi:MAG TPA: YbgC/FadM family acyl-CoA thioesterase [Gammaproteobacteria bacterium]|nr:YbgC/FadM family acyl-CoA thioesterase [Gammaproteobacteria bacterium]
MSGAAVKAFVLPVRVYLEDTDAQGVVYNASYFRFMERARTEWLRARGVEHAELRAEHGVQLVLTRVEAELRAPGRLSDLLQVEAAVLRAGGARIVFAHEILREGPGELTAELVCRGIAEVGCIDAEQGRPRRLPAILLTAIQESGLKE